MPPDIAVVVALFQAGKRLDALERLQDAVAVSGGSGVTCLAMAKLTIAWTLTQAAQTEDDHVRDGLLQAGLYCALEQAAEGVLRHNSVQSLVLFMGVAQQCAGHPFCMARRAAILAPIRKAYPDVRAVLEQQSFQDPQVVAMEDVPGFRWPFEFAAWKARGKVKELRAYFLQSVAKPYNSTWQQINDQEQKGRSRLQSAGNTMLSLLPSFLGIPHGAAAQDAPESLSLRLIKVNPDLLPKEEVAPLSRLIMRLSASCEAEQRQAGKGLPRRDSSVQQQRAAKAQAAELEKWLLQKYQAAASQAPLASEGEHGVFEVMRLSWLPLGFVEEEVGRLEGEGQLSSQVAEAVQRAIRLGQEGRPAWFSLPEWLPPVVPQPAAQANGFAQLALPAPGSAAAQHADPGDYPRCVRNMLAALDTGFAGRSTAGGAGAAAGGGFQPSARDDGTDAGAMAGGGAAGQEREAELAGHLAGSTSSARFLQALLRHLLQRDEVQGQAPSLLPSPVGSFLQSMYLTLGDLPAERVFELEEQDPPWGAGLLLPAILAVSAGKEAAQETGGGSSGNQPQQEARKQQPADDAPAAGGYAALEPQQHEFLGGSLTATCKGQDVFDSSFAAAFRPGGVAGGGKGPAAALADEWQATKPVTVLPLRNPDPAVQPLTQYTFLWHTVVPCIDAMRGPDIGAFGYEAADHFVTGRALEHQALVNDLLFQTAAGWSLLRSAAKLQLQCSCSGTGGDMPARVVLWEEWERWRGHGGEEMLQELAGQDTVALQRGQAVLTQLLANPGAGFSPVEDLSRLLLAVLVPPDSSSGDRLQQQAHKAALMVIACGLDWLAARRRLTPGACDAVLKCMHGCLELQGQTWGSRKLDATQLAAVLHRLPLLRVTQLAVFVAQRVMAALPHPALLRLDWMPLALCKPVILKEDGVMLYSDGLLALQCAPQEAAGRQSGQEYTQRAGCLRGEPWYFSDDPRDTLSQLAAACCGAPRPQMRSADRGRLLSAGTLGSQRASWGAQLATLVKLAYVRGVLRLHLHLVGQEGQRVHGLRREVYQGMCMIENFLAHPPAENGKDEQQLEPARALADRMHSVADELASSLRNHCGIRLLLTQLESQNINKKAVKAMADRIVRVKARRRALKRQSELLARENERIKLARRSGEEGEEQAVKDLHKHCRQLESVSHELLDCRGWADTLGKLRPLRNLLQRAFDALPQLCCDHGAVANLHALVDALGDAAYQAAGCLLMQHCAAPVTEPLFEVMVRHLLAPRWQAQSAREAEEALRQQEEALRALLEEEEGGGVCKAKKRKSKKPGKKGKQQQQPAEQPAGQESHASNTASQLVSEPRGILQTESGGAVAGEDEDTFFSAQGSPLQLSALDEDDMPPVNGVPQQAQQDAGEPAMQPRPTQQCSLLPIIPDAGGKPAQPAAATASTSDGSRVPLPPSTPCPGAAAGLAPALEARLLQAEQAAQTQQQQQQEPEQGAPLPASEEGAWHTTTSKRSKRQGLSPHQQHRKADGPAAANGGPLRQAGSGGTPAQQLGGSGGTGLAASAPRIVRWTGHWMCGCGHLNAPRHHCRECGAFQPCREFVFQGGCSRGGHYKSGGTCRYPHPVFDLPPGPPPGSKRGLLPDGQPLISPPPGVPLRSERSSPAASAVPSAAQRQPAGIAPAKPQPAPATPPAATPLLASGAGSDAAAAEDKPATSVPTKHTKKAGGSWPAVLAAFQAANAASAGQPGDVDGCLEVISEASSQGTGVAETGSETPAGWARRNGGEAGGRDAAIGDAVWPAPGETQEQAELQAAIQASLGPAAADSSSEAGRDDGSSAVDAVSKVSDAATYSDDLALAGLRNDVGQYNCFLNVIIQCLWRCADFRREVSSWDEALCTNDAIVSALHQLFQAFQQQEQQRCSDSSSGSNLAPVDPSQLRAALAALPGQQFGIGEMSDAAEVLLSIYERVMEAASTAGQPSQLSGIFGLPVREEVHCHRCGKVTHQTSYTQYFHNTQATTLRLLACDASARSTGALVCAADSQHQKSCDKDLGGCGAPNLVNHFLEGAPPRVFTLQVAWESHKAAPQDIAATLAALDEEVDLREVYQGADRGAPRYCLRSMVCYYGHHYQALVLVPDAGGWLMFDDTRVSRVGAWADVRRKCEAGRIQPSVLFYESVVQN